MLWPVFSLWVMSWGVLSTEGSHSFWRTSKMGRLEGSRYFWRTSKMGRLYGQNGSYLIFHVLMSMSI